jgi:hypothetical protein
MSLDGLRAWIGEVERKLGMRTRVFLVLSVIAIGGAGAAIYLAIDARESSVSESDVQALQRELEARIGEGGAAAAGAGTAQLEAELNALRARVEQLEGEGGGAKEGKSSQSSAGSPGAEAGKGAAESQGEARGKEASGGGEAPSGGASAKLKGLVEKAKGQSEGGEPEPSGK